MTAPLFSVSACACLLQAGLQTLSKGRSRCRLEACQVSCGRHCVRRGSVLQTRIHLQARLLGMEPRSLMTGLLSAGISAMQMPCRGSKVQYDRTRAGNSRARSAARSPRMSNLSACVQHKFRT